MKVAPSKLNLIPLYVVGSFGSKYVLGKVIAIAAMLAKVSGRPVKFMEDRIDNLVACENLASDRYYDSELAITRDGLFKSLRVRVVDDYDAYSSSVTPPTAMHWRKPLALIASRAWRTPSSVC